MEITFAQTEKILKTLTIGYYIKRNIDTKLDNCEASHYDMMNDKIVVSFQQVQKSLESISDIENLEYAIRCLLYHETSHAVLTPKDLAQIANDYCLDFNILNIFEDERIETILKDFYLNVNFKLFIRQINHYKGETPKSALEMFYQIVRYRVGPTKFTDKVQEIIYNYQQFENYWEKAYYISEIKQLYKDISDLFSTSDVSSETSSDSSSKTVDVQTNVDRKSTDNSDEDNKESVMTDIPQGNECDSFKIDNKQVIKRIQSLVNKYVDSDIDDKVTQILQNFKSTTRSNSSAINAYSGVFNPRSVIRDDYKYFVQQNRLGHVKQFSKLHLNLFIDCSGSFHKSDDTINCLLHSLIKFEKSNRDFSFDLISCGMGQVIKAKSDRIQCSTGGNNLDKNIYQQFIQQQFKDSQNINIVCFDGDAYSDSYYVHDNTFKAFDTNNTIIISDYDNAKWLRKLKTAKVILTYTYTSELISNVLTSLQQLCR